MKGWVGVGLAFPLRWIVASVSSRSSGTLRRSAWVFAFARGGLLVLARVWVLAGIGTYYGLTRPEGGLL